MTDFPDKPKMSTLPGSSFPQVEKIDLLPPEGTETDRIVQQGDTFGRRNLGRADTTSASVPLQPLSHPAVPDGQRILVFGGSFSPPTAEHMGVLARLMARFQIRRAIVMPTDPYKKNAAPAEVSLGLSRIAVGNFDQSLRRNNIDFHNFVGNEEAGSARWEDGQGRPFEISVSDYEITHRIKGETLKTLPALPGHLAELWGEKVSPSQLFWLSGSDSFASIQSWDPKWQELLGGANWVVVRRTDNDGDDDLNFRATNPLKTMFSESVLAKYRYSFDGTHRYAPVDGKAPGIFLVDAPSLDVSSTKVRKALADGGPAARDMLEPAVFRACLTQGYYSGDLEQVFNRPNIEHYLRHLFAELKGGQNDPEIFQQVADKLIALSLDASEERDPGAEELGAEKDGAKRLVMTWIIQNLAEHEDLSGLRAQLGSMAPEKQSEALSVARRVQKILARYVTPAMAYAVGGAPGTCLQQMATISSPKQIAEHSRESSEAPLSGDPEFDQELTSLRKRLLRGDPDAILDPATHMEGPFALDDGGITLNIVKSALPKWVPLWIRRLEDQAVTWYDLNLSTNELRSILGNEKLDSFLAESAQGDDALYAHLMLAAVQRDERATMRLEMFAGHRTFRRLALGDAPVELLPSFSKAEREFMERVRKESELASTFSESEREALKNVLADFFVLARAAHDAPQRLADGDFWEDYLDLLTTGYPGEKLNLGKGAHRDMLAQRLPLLAKLGTLVSPKLFAGVTIRYRGQPLLTFSGEGKSSALVFDPLRQAVAKRGQNCGPKERTQTLALNSAARSYVQQHRNVFRSNPHRQQSVRVHGQSLLERASKQENLVWEINVLRSGYRRQLQVARKGFEHAQKFLEVQNVHPEAKSTLEEALLRLLERHRQIERDILALEYRWLQVRMAHPMKNTPEGQMQGFEEASGEFVVLRQRAEALLDGIRELSHLMLGVVPLDLKDIQVLRKSIETTLSKRP